MKYKYKIRGCTFCGTCVSECPENAITMTDKDAKIDQKKCINCGICYDNCAFEAIERIEYEGEKGEEK